MKQRISFLSQMCLLRGPRQSGAAGRARSLSKVWGLRCTGRWGLCPHSRPPFTHPHPRADICTCPSSAQGRTDGGRGPCLHQLVV